jgi:hypothetical protein
MVAKRFVYGNFKWSGKQQHTLPPILDMDRIAIEIVREYGANELVGKIHMKFGNQWVPLDPSRLEQVEWMQAYKRFPLPSRSAGIFYYFDMEGSGHWAVLHFRTESDESGVYVAVALRYKEK